MRWRKKKGRPEKVLLKLTRNRLAESLGVHPKTIEKWLENGRISLSGDPIEDLAPLYLLIQQHQGMTSAPARGLG
jgi:DNA-binding transcriptional regulator YiaG